MAVQKSSIQSGDKSHNRPRSDSSQTQSTNIRRSRLVFFLFLLIVSTHLWTSGEGASGKALAERWAYTSPVIGEMDNVK